MPEARPRQSVDFDNRNPPKTVTDPNGLGANPVVPPAFQQYVYRANPDVATMSADERKAYLSANPFGDMKLVRSEQELLEAKADGWQTTPQPIAPKKHPKAA